MSSLPFIAARHLKSRHDFSFITVIGYLSIAGLAIGVCVLILTLSILNGFERQIQEKIISFDGHIRLKSYLGGPLPATNSLLDSVMRRIPEILDRAPYVHHSAVLRYGLKTEGVFLEGISAKKAKSVFGTPDLLLSGEFHFQENEDGYSGIVVGSALAEKLGLSTGNRVVLFDLSTIGSLGKPPRLGQFYVAGTYKTGLREYDETIVYMDITSAQQLVGYDDKITGEILKLESAQSAAPVADKLNQLAGYPYFPSTWKDRHHDLFAWLSVQKYPITIIFALTALVAIINITSSLTMIVMEKVRDIGVLRAMGYSRRGISGLFVLEGGVVGLVGALLGEVLALVLGLLQMKYGILRIPEDVYFMKELPILFEVIHFVTVGAIAFLLALGATLYPSWKASCILPGEAVRYE
ncbi:MAG: ABC transporter permease [Candidatus Neomarinimicrobiota bacterium]